MRPRILATVASALVPASFPHSARDLVFVEPVNTIFNFTPKLALLILCVLLVVCALMVMCVYSYFKKPGRLWALSFLRLGLVIALTPCLLSIGIIFFHFPDIEPKFNQPAFVLLTAGIVYTTAGYLALKQNSRAIPIKETSNQQDSNSFVRLLQRTDYSWPRILTTIAVVLLLSTIVIPIQDWTTGKITADPVTLLHLPPLWLVTACTPLMCLYVYCKTPGNHWSAWIIIFGFAAILTVWIWPTGTILWDGVDEQGRMTGGMDETYRSLGTYLVTLAGLATITAGNLTLAYKQQKSALLTNTSI